MASPRYEVMASEAFVDDLEDATSYYLEQSGPHSASRFLRAYDSFVDLLGTLPRHGSKVGESGLWWRKVGAFIAIYAIDDATRSVTLLRLYYLTSDWRRRVLGER